MNILEPATPEQFEKYYRLRYLTLRQPWGQPEGSERADDDATATHAMLVDNAGEAIGVCRMHLQTPQEAQIRFMGIHENYQGKGLGKLLLDYLEDKARSMGATNIVLQAREKAVSFYERNGYKVVEKTHLLFGSIQHYKMEKQL
ncbi:GNAT family N-acetyltransferase [Pontibacter sp. KCTC 32443]|uniref:GNAT family N-acetyltransferase n=1 Tax=Pontibacter TaxID=323449 RepID=UPI00164DFEF8|nr:MULTISPECIES: GNAT family N-acetyltransferase [Pontibacter]MBC5774255.1 GNAT family N-acetyltransferase [Pontibacter sp. KCTC 32443]